METPPVGPAVNATGASCRLGPSPTALAIRLEGLQARDGAALDELLEQLPEPPWDADVSADDADLIASLGAKGFIEYARGTLFVRAAEGLSGPRVQGVEVVPYENRWAPAFTAAEAEAMDGLAAFGELGSPSGYEWGEGQGSFRIARTTEGQVVGFAHANLPDGVVDWLGVVPGYRRRGVGRQLLAQTARDVLEVRGTHLLAFAQDGTGAAAFLGRLGFSPRGRRVLMIRRTP
jgi:GNAT superfamily N-acetyltransferase